MKDLEGCSIKSFFISHKFMGHAKEVTITSWNHIEHSGAR